jgi:hypothetical protein
MYMYSKYWLTKMMLTLRLNKNLLLHMYIQLYVNIEMLKEEKQILIEYVGVKLELR